MLNRVAAARAQMLHFVMRTGKFDEFENTLVEMGFASPSLLHRRSSSTLPPNPHAGTPFPHGHDVHADPDVSPAQQQSVEVGPDGRVIDGPEYMPAWAELMVNNWQSDGKCFAEW